MLYNLFENRDFVSVFAVALLAEGVDRNKFSQPPPIMSVVALLAEGVDRNKYVAPVAGALKVALLAEGVDRNSSFSLMQAAGILSPSSRRAWIEICRCSGIASPAVVALLAEGVDRNFRLVLLHGQLNGRPPRGGRG